MGSIISGVLGGGSKTQTTGNAGFTSLPPEIQNAYKNFSTQVNNQIPNALTAYKPMGQTADETAAFNQIRQGFTPTAQSLQNDVSMLMNPFDQFVIDDVNRQAGGDFSILKQNMNQAGQFGSNRQQLGANDIEQTRLGTIGKLRQDQYNQALGQVFNNIVPQRQQDAQGMLGIGNFQRGLDTATNSSQITGLQEIAKALGMLPQNNAGNSSTQSTPGNWMTAAGNVASIAGFLSDRRAKEKIVPAGEENGHKIYEFSYKGFPERYVGVMADEVPEEARILIGDYWAVNYDMIGVEFRRVS